VGVIVLANSIKSLESILSLDIIKSLLRANTLEISRLNTTIALLIKAGVPFDVTFNPATRRIESAAQLTIYINPTTTLSFTFEFDAGPAVRFTDG
jgi:hypothetical protein